MKKIFCLTFLPLLLGGCSIKKTEEKLDISDIKIPVTNHEYFEIQDMSINWSDILEQNKDTYYVYIYSLTCSHCTDLKNWIIDKALDRKDIYFVKGSNKDVIKSDVSITIGAMSISEIAILGYPSLLKISDKKLVKNIAGNAKIMNALV